MDETALQELLERVKVATGPGHPPLRYIDCHLWVLSKGGDARMVVCDSSEQDFVWERGIDGFWIRSVVKFRAVPKYTTSVAAALALVERCLPGAEMHITINHPKNEWVTASIRVAPLKLVSGEEATLPLAILAALLTALIAQAEA